MNLLSKYLIIPILLLLVIVTSNAQTTLMKKEKSIYLDSLTIKIDSLSIYPNTFIMRTIDEKKYSIDYITATLHIQDSTLLGQTILCSYYVFDIDFSKKIYHKSPLLILRKGNVYTPEIINLST